MPEIPAFLTFKKISEPLTSSRKNINEKYSFNSNTNKRKFNYISEQVLQKKLINYYKGND